MTLRPDVDAVDARISELGPGPDSWPFADIILVVGKTSPSSSAKR
jgi:hypothetical protein